MANLQAYFQTLVKHHTDLKDFIIELNEDMLRSTKGEKFVTFFIGVYNLNTKLLQFVNSGHNPPLLFHQNKIQELHKGSTLLGMFKELPSIEVGQVQIEADATILLYTDGLSDLRNEAGDMIPIGRSKIYLKQNAHLNTKEFIDRLMLGVNEFRGEAEFPDDLTILCIKLFA
jgi:sigma-B regulation protein RsbU (phosphoserine phosphatase)